MLECFTHLFVQTEASAKLLSKLGISENVSVSGDTRFRQRDRDRRRSRNRCH